MKKSEVHSDRNKRKTAMAWAVKYRFAYFILFIIISSSAFLFYSCTNPFSPKLSSDPSQALLLTEQKSTEGVFQNFQYAYTFRDSLLYADLLDSSFTFEYFDPNIGESGAFASWGREIELKTTGRLLAAFETIDLQWLRIVYESPIENNEQTVYRNFRLRLLGGDINITLQGSAIFTFIKRMDDKWRIKQWVDESNL